MCACLLILYSEKFDPSDELLAYIHIHIFVDIIYIETYT